MPKREETGCSAPSRVKNFCDGTNLHCFKHVCETTSIVSRSFWVVFLAVASAAATYQIGKVVLKVSNTPSSTLITPYEGPVHYPKLCICQPHWMYWLNVTKARHVFNLDDDTLLVAVSFLGMAYSRRRFNVTEAQIKLNDVMRSHNFTQITQLYLALAEDQPNGFVGWKFGFDKKFVHKQLCYVPLNVSWVRNPAIGTLTLNLKFDHRSYRSVELSAQEYIRYFSDHSNVILKPLAQDSTADSYQEQGLILSPRIYVDGRTERIVINQNFFEYKVQLKATFYKWIDSESRPCQGGAISTNANYFEECFLSCGLKTKYSDLVVEQFDSIRLLNMSFNDTSVNNTSYHRCVPFSHLSILNDDQSYTVCQYPIYQMHHKLDAMDQDEALSTGDGDALMLDEAKLDDEDDDEFVKESLVMNSVLRVRYDDAPAYRINAEKGSNISEDCSRSCVPWCLRFTYDKNVLTNQHAAAVIANAEKLRVTQVQIAYLGNSHVLSHIEQLNFNWENVIGEVGGILSLWLGGSLLSFFQAVYLCCMCSPKRRMFPIDYCYHREQVERKTAQQDDTTDYRKSGSAKILDIANTIKNKWSVSEERIIGQNTTQAQIKELKI